MNRRRPLAPGWAPVALAVLLAGPLTESSAWARVKLVTLPVRDRVEVHLEHESATLVEEERVVPLVKGRNQVDFSWANTRIDPNTIVFRVLGPAEGPAVRARVLSVSYPPNEQALVWAVYADRAGAARVRISYLLGGLGRSYAYRAITSADERRLTLRRYLRLSNQANEGFGQANLHMADGRRVDTPIDIAQTRQILVDRHANLPVVKTYTADVARHGYLDPAEKKLRIPMHYVVRNDEDHGLGRAPLPAGKVRIFQTDSKGTQAFLGEDWGAATPVDDAMRLYLGVAQDIVVRRHIEKRRNRSVQGRLRHVEVVVRYEIENFKSKKVRLDLVESVTALRNELGLRGGLQSQLVIGKTASDALTVDEARSGLQELVMSRTLPRRTSTAKKQTVRLYLTFENEW